MFRKMTRNDKEMDVSHVYNEEVYIHILVTNSNTSIFVVVVDGFLPADVVHENLSGD